jgi:4,5-dihydroxyphthalate decarboxylase
MNSDIELTFNIADYHRTNPLLTGEVAPSGIKLTRRTAEPGEACHRPVYELFDIAEMSLSWYVMARCKGEPVIALPIFPLRMFVQPYLFCRAQLEAESPEDLRGKRVAMAQYRLTVGLWTRGILSEEYGIHPTDMQWITSEAEEAGFEVPSSLNLTNAEEDPESLLLKGHVDAIILPNTSPAFRAGDPRIRRLFKNIRATVENYYRATQIFPITHTLVAREKLVDENPWIVKSLLDAFELSEIRCRQAYEYTKRLAFPTSVLILEEEERMYGKHPWTHGLAENQKVLQKFLIYAQQQGYVQSCPELNDLFAPIGN